MSDLQMTCPQIREGEGAITIVAHDSYKGRVIYDSRLDMPCDFEPRRREQEARRREREQST